MNLMNAVICKLIEEQETMLSNARRKLMKEEIEAEDFNIIKKRNVISNCGN